MNLATVISYCTNDYRFINHCIAEARKFSQQIVIPVCDHFFDGKPENRMLLEHTYAQNPDCIFVEFAYLQDRLYNPYLRFTPEDQEWIPCWHATVRYIGYLHLDPKIDWVLFLDCDEIVEGDRLVKQLYIGDHNAIRLACYYYVLRPDFRADKVQSLPLLIRKLALSKFSHSDDRYALYKYAPEPKKQDVRGLDGKPFIHHYSWVRPQSECLHKAATWGHHRDQDWSKLIAEAFSQKRGSHLFGTDLQFAPIEDVYFDPLSVEIPKNQLHRQAFKNVKKVDHRAILKMELEASYGLL